MKKVHSSFQKAKVLLKDCKSLCVLTGAGISQEPEFATFRDADKIWAQVRLEEVATPEAFARDPVRVHDFYNARRRGLRRVGRLRRGGWGWWSLLQDDARLAGGLLGRLPVNV